MTDTLEATDLATIEHLDFEVPCEGPNNGGHHQDGHAADWGILQTCGCTSNCCDAWLQFCEHMWAAGFQAVCVKCMAFDPRIASLTPLRNQV